jgi:hypothetical protein
MVLSFQKEEKKEKEERIQNFLYSWLPFAQSVISI